jgi:hypothetical protein
MVSFKIVQIVMAQIQLTPQTTMRLNWVPTGLCRAKAQDGAHLGFTLQKVQISSSVFSDVRICTPNFAGVQLGRASPRDASEHDPPADVAPAGRRR